MLKDRFIEVEGKIVDTVNNSVVPPPGQAELLEILNSLYKYRVFIAAVSSANTKIFYGEVEEIH